MEESGARESWGARPVPKYEFDKSWKPKKDHREAARMLGLTDEQVLERAHHCRHKLYEHPFKTEDDQFHRELAWLARDAEKDRHNERRKAETDARRRLNEAPGSKRAATDARPDPAFGRRSAG